MGNASRSSSSSRVAAFHCAATISCSGRPISSRQPGHEQQRPRCARPARQLRIRPEPSRRPGLHHARQHLPRIAIQVDEAGFRKHPRGTARAAQFFGVFSSSRTGWPVPRPPAIPVAQRFVKKRRRSVSVHVRRRIFGEQTVGLEYHAIPALSCGTPSISWWLSSPIVNTPRARASVSNSNVEPGARRTDDEHRAVEHRVAAWRRLRERRRVCRTSGSALLRRSASATRRSSASSATISPIALASADSAAPSASKSRRPGIEDAR